jgi:short-subunit dehydrogenase
MFNYRGSTALITGASSGLGEQFAETLAARGCDVILAARSEPALDALATRLAATHGIRAYALRTDLSEPFGPAVLHDDVTRLGLQVDLLINNAGFGLGGAFLDHPLRREQEQIQVNIQALVALTHLFVPAMVARRRGGVINLASAAAFQGVPYLSVYAATKAFVLSFSEALGRELRDSRVHVLAVCPGAVATRFFEFMGKPSAPAAMDQPATIVAQALAAFERSRPMLIPGKLSVRLAAWGTRLLPRALVSQQAEKIGRKFQP